MSEWMERLSPAQLGIIPIIIGLLCLLGSVFGWEWLYPDGGKLRFRSLAYRRVALFFAGLTFVSFGAMLIFLL